MFSVALKSSRLLIIKSLCYGCSSPGSQFYSGWEGGGKEELREGRGV